MNITPGNLILISLVAAVAFISFYMWNSRGPAIPIEIGGLYSIKSVDGKYRIAKILALDEGGLHVRIYQNQFVDRPTKVNQAELKLGPFDAEEYSIGHIPILRENFFRSEPVYLQTVVVTGEELEGYRMWKDASNSYFNFERL